MGFTLLGLDGESRDSSTVYSGLSCGADSHGLNTIAGFMLRKTSLSGGQHEDVEQFDGDTSYGSAVEAKHRLLTRLHYGANGSYAVIDTLYNCGCRGMA